MKKKLFAVVLACMMILSAVPAFAQTEGDDARNVVVPDNVEWTGDNTVYYNGEYFETLSAALKAVYMSNPNETAEVYCKPKADLGVMTHAHVADDIIIYGNNARVTGGEHDLEVDTFKFNRETGNQDKNGDFLTKDIKIVAKNLDGIAVWGQRNTAHKVDVVFEGCDNINRMYVSGISGDVNYTVTDCTFDVSQGSHKNTSIYTNAPGTINLNNVSFKGMALAINQNNKSDGIQTINVNNCVFEDCSEKSLVDDVNARSYAAPVRIVAQNNAKSILNISNSEFKYSDGFERTPYNGDVLIGDGRKGNPAGGICEFNATENKGPFKVSLQEANFYDENGNAVNPDNARNIDVNEGDSVFTDTEGDIVVDDHSKTVVSGKKDATCQEEGYTGDTVCEVCEKVIKKGVAIPKVSHNYVDGKCTMCDEPEPENPEIDNPGTDKPETDDPGTDKPETDKPGTDKPETDKPGTDKPETDKPGTDKPETDKPGTDKPETDKPEADKPETEKPETPQTGDESNMAYLAMMLGAASAMAVVLRRKYNK